MRIEQSYRVAAIQAAAGHEPVIKPPAGVMSVVVEGSDHLVVDNLDLTEFTFNPSLRSITPSSAKSNCCPRRT